MKQYKGYYIDGVIFNSKEEIYEHIKNELVRSYKNHCELFATVDCNAAMASACDEIAEKLVNDYGFTWEELDEIEFEAIA